MHLLRWALAASLLISAFLVHAQKPSPQGKWWVELRDKDRSPYCTCRPTEFLSARALERRAKASIPVTEEDLPVNPQYVNTLRKRPGVRIHGTSRWLNAVTVIADSTAAYGLLIHPFVKSITYIGRDIPPRNPANRPDKKRRPAPDYPREAEARFGQMGYSAVNLAPLATGFLQATGARGADIWVAVLDGGFTNTDTIPLFDSVALAGRLWPGPDFVERDRAVYESAQHGTSVLSVMAANLPGHFVGAAPDATYFLLKTEDTAGEFPVEEANWISGAEWADSIGVDILNASLGYTSFSDTSLNHRYAQLDGRTAIGSRGAAVAARKGMLVFNAAGNSGDEPWKHLGVPSDAVGVVAVGATDSQTDDYAKFSSQGPSADGRIKPDLAAPGLNVIAAAFVGTELEVTAGTSIASPILAGSVAALWSAYPERTGTEILDAVLTSADQRWAPDNLRGYGLPNLGNAWLRLGRYRQVGNVEFASFDRYTGVLRVLVPGEILPAGVTEFVLKNKLGTTVRQGNLRRWGGELTVLEIGGLEQVPAGAYGLEIGGAKWRVGL